MESVNLQNTGKHLSIVSRFYVSNRIYCDSPNNYLLQSVIQKIYKCDAKFFSLQNQYITANEFEFLVDKSKVEKFSLRNGAIIARDEIPVTVEYMLTKLPYAHTIE